MYDGKTQLLIKNPINRYLIQLANAAEHEEERGRFAHTLHSERFARCGQGEQLADSGISIQAMREKIFYARAR
jgi:hypothetical protein